MLVRTLRITALATSCLWPMVAWADDSDFDPVEPSVLPDARKPVLVNQLSVGAGYQTGNSARFGRFTGSDQQGGVGTGAFRLEDRATGETEGSFFLRAAAEDLDLFSNRLFPDASAALLFGQQGTWDAGLNYDGIPYRRTDRFHTLFNSDGRLVNGLAAGSINITGSNAAGDAKANQYFDVIAVATRRDRLDGKVSYAGLEDWLFSSRLEHEHKQGGKINSFLFTGDNRFAAFLEPVDYDTQRFTATAAYTTRPFQATLSYRYSGFTNNKSEFDMISPFAGAATAPRVYVASQYSLPPSNSEHQIKSQLGLNVTDTTHLATTLRYGLQVQNDDLKARYYEAASTAAPAISDQTYDGLIQNYYGNLALTSRPLKDLSIRASYTVDDRDNASRVYRLRSYRGDYATSVFNGTGDTRNNAPYSFLNQIGDLEIAYRLDRSTRVTMDYGFEDRRRTYSVTNHNQEWTAGAAVHSTLTDGLTAVLGYSRALRQATRYDGNAGWASLGRPIKTETNLGMYSYAARDRDEIKANLTWSLDGGTALGVTARYVSDYFPKTYFGVTDARTVSLGPDISFSPTTAIRTSFYYTYQENLTNNLTTNSTTANGAQWSLKNKDMVHTLGTRADWHVTDRLKLTAEDNFSYGDTAFEEAGWVQGVAVSAVNTAVSLPNSKSLTNSLRLAAEYAACENVFFGLSGLWQRFLSRDYLNAQQAASTANQAATAAIAGEGSPNYAVGVLMATTRIVW